MSKNSDFLYRTSAIRKAARGRLVSSSDVSARAETVYGFSNFALKKSRSELSDAWDAASATLSTDKAKNDK